MSLVIYLALIGLILYVILWGIGAMGVPEPFNKVIRVIVILVVVIIVVNLLLSLLGHPLVAAPPIRFK